MQKSEGNNKVGKRRESDRNRDTQKTKESKKDKTLIK